MINKSSSIKKVAIPLFFFITSLYILTHKGFCSGDEKFHYDVVQNFIHTGHPSLPASEYDIEKDKWLRAWAAKGRDNELYLTLAPGLSLASVPLGLVGYAIEHIIDSRNLNNIIDKETDIFKKQYYLRKTPAAFFTTLINPIMSALLVLIFFSFCHGLTSSPRKSLFTSLTLGCGTIIWPYSSTYWTQPIITFCLFSSFYCIYMFSRNEKREYLQFAGLGLGYAFLTRFETMLFIPFYFIYLLIIKLRNKHRIIETLLLFIAPIAGCILAEMIWNYYRFGSIMQTGAWHQTLLRRSFRANLLISLPVNLASLNRSIFIYSPPIVLFFFAIKNYFRHYRTAAIILTTIIIFNVLLYSKFYGWQALSGWGPRFLVPITPFMLLPVCLFIARDKKKTIITGILTTIGFLIQLIAVLLPPQLMAYDAYFGDLYNNPLSFFQRSEIVPQVKMLLAGNFELWWLNGPIAFLIGVILLILCGGSFYVLMKQVFAKSNHRT